MHLLHSSIAKAVIVQMQHYPILVSTKANRIQNETRWKLKMAYATHTYAPNSGLFGRLVELRKDIAQRFAFRRVFNKTVNELNGLDDRQLADLGLSRSQIHSVALEHTLAAFR